VVPVGGGWLAAGSCRAARALCPGVAVFGAEPAGADDTHRSLRAGERRSIPVVLTAADGLRHRRPGRVTFPILRRELRDVLLVSENDIVTAMRLVHDCIGDVVEPSGACALAAVLAHPGVFAGQRVGVLVSGGNVDRAVFGALTEQVGPGGARTRSVVR
jgi:threonine dehydratase